MEQIHNLVKKIIDTLFTFLYRGSFYRLGQKSTLCMPFSINGAKWMNIGSKVYIKQGAWLLALHQPNQLKSQEKLIIGSNTYIGRNAHIVALQKVHISDDVLMGDNVYIADNFHGFKAGNIPYKNQDVGFKKEAFIGAGSWLGENVCVISAHVGKQCIIGANSVVTKDIPDYCMAVGAPAKVIKRFDVAKNQWVKEIEQ